VSKASGPAVIRERTSPCETGLPIIKEAVLPDWLRSIQSLISRLESAVLTMTEWFRRTTWSDADREDFNVRLKRSRGAGNKSQYLRLQAFHLGQAGHHAGAIELLDRLFVEFPDKIQLAQAHAQKADSLAKLGHIEAAIGEYRASLQAERDYPNVCTNAWLDFGWFVLEMQLTPLYDEVARVLEEFRKKDGIKFPAIEYRYTAILALLADERGEKEQAREFAKQALAEAAKEHSGLRYHPTVGLVGSESNGFLNQLMILARS
jgi:tetratricopeptide (TPR) repeat protein